MIMTNSVKQFIEKHIDLIENNWFDELFTKYCMEFDEYTNSDLVDILRSVGIDVLENMSKIYKGMFAGSSVEQVIIPNNIRLVDNYAFRSCLKLTTVKIPGSVKSIGISAFDDCINLTDITIDKGLSSISEECFAACISLKQIILPDTVLEIPSHAFGGCTDLQHIGIGNGIKRICDNAFAGCKNLTTITYNGPAKEFRKINIGRSYSTSNKIKVQCLDEVLYININLL